MKTLQPDILYLKRKERKSLLIVVGFLIISSFTDEAFASLTSIWSQSNENYSLESNLELSRTPEKTLLSEDSALIKKDSIVRKVNLIESDSIRKIQKEVVAIPTKTIPTEVSKISLFNPNDVDEKTLLNMGISSFTTRNWIRYLEAGGRFYKKEDLKKIYGLDDEKYEELQARLLFPKKAPKKHKSYTKQFDINSGQADDFKQIQGIGKVLSERIIKFRDKLGGFHDVEQIKEVYGIDSNIIELHYSIFLIETDVQKLNINSISEIKLSKHPYFSTAIAKSIINNRRQNGNYLKAEDFLRINIIQKSWVKKVEPYIDF